MASAPIGVFDSGVGGLSVLRAIRAALPREDLLYIADSGYAPYGEKPVRTIQARALFLTRFLLGQRAKAIVVACNTATAAAAELLRATVPVPIVALEPGIKPAAVLTHAGVVGVLATAGTLSSPRFATLVEKYGRTVTVVTQACPGLAAQVEAGDLTGPATRTLVERYTAPLLAAGADILVLGCTHYPFLLPLLTEVVGPNVTLVETGQAVARQLVHVLAENQLLAAGVEPGTVSFWSSGNEEEVGHVVARLWGQRVIVRRLPVDVDAHGKEEQLQRRDAEAQRRRD